jgi:hypothetical protein
MSFNNLVYFVINEAMGLENGTMKVQIFVFCGDNFSRSYVQDVPLILELGPRCRQVLVSYVAHFTQI